MAAPAVVIRRTMAIVILTVAVGVLAAPLFRAPARIDVATWPADGASLSAGPAAVRLSAPAPVRPGEVHITVVNAAGQIMSVGAPRVSGAEVSQPIGRLPTGSYRVAYHLELENLTQVSGSTAFGVGTAAQPAGWDEAEARDRSGAPAAGGHQHVADGLDPLTALALGANVIVLAGIAVLEVRRRRAV
ncbi:hypothetical protein F4558_001274 [Micromonospora profundi]|uniref:copper resistance protein CopC n=1 Tax=Micromonospora profundi TaxID=1420889 RepID=UPI0016B1A12E|nr:copper resistance protein CopC [Micromonospora profundi]NJC11448.1 hypothetical protein [Micromonospora profundi]